MFFSVFSCFILFFEDAKRISILGLDNDYKFSMRLSRMLPMTG